MVGQGGRGGGGGICMDLHELAQSTLTTGQHSMHRWKHTSSPAHLHLGLPISSAHVFALGHVSLSLRKLRLRVVG